jgi:hypothetical protein
MFVARLRLVMQAKPSNSGKKLSGKPRLTALERRKPQDASEG